MSHGDQLGLIGIVLTVIFGVAAFFAAKTIKSKRQNQKVGKNGIGIQSGRDTKL